MRVSLSHKVPHKRICLRNTEQMGPSVNTVVSDFVYRASGDDLQVNSECIGTKSNKQLPEPFLQMI